MSSRTELDHYTPKPKWIRYILGYFALFLVHTLTRVKISGRENIPSRGPFIVAVNHFSYIDPPFVIAAVQKPITFLAASDQVIMWYFKWAAWLYGFIPTNRTQLAPSTIKKAKQVLQNNEILGIFPEGTSTASYIRPAKRGIAYLSTINNTTILPVAIYGLAHLWMNWAWGTRPLVAIKIGKPFQPKITDQTFENRDEEMNATGDNIMCRIAALLPENVRGQYKKDERIKIYETENKL